MTTTATVHSQTGKNLFTRPPHEQCNSFEHALHRAHTFHRVSEEEVISTAAVSFDVGTAPEGGNQVRMVVGGQHFTPTNFVLGQVGNHTRVNLALMNRLNPETLAAALDETWTPGEYDLPERLKFLFAQRGDQRVIRGFTGANYHRLWDYQILDAIERWLIPNGWRGATPTVNQSFARRNADGTSKPALFLGDRSSHFFFTSSTRDDHNGGMFSGLTVNNSEVGFRAFDFSTFVFMEMCSNFLIWSPREIKSFIYRHTPGGIGEGWKCFMEQLQALTHEMNPVIMNTLEAAKELTYQEPVEKPTKAEFRAADRAGVISVKNASGVKKHARAQRAIKKLTQRTGLTVAQAKRGVDAAHLGHNNQGQDPFSVWGMVQGITDAAKGEAYQDGMVGMIEAGSSLLSLAEVS